MAAAAILDFFEPEIAPLDHRQRKPHPRTKHGVDRTTGCGDMAIKFFQDGGGRHLGFFRTGNSAISSAVPENPTLEPNMDRTTGCKDMAI